MFFKACDLLCKSEFEQEAPVNSKVSSGIETGLYWEYRLSESVDGNYC